MKTALDSDWGNMALFSSASSIDCQLSCFCSFCPKLGNLHHSGSIDFFPLVGLLGLYFDMWFSSSHYFFLLFCQFSRRIAGFICILTNINRSQRLCCTQVNLFDSVCVLQTQFTFFLFSHSGMFFSKHNSPIKQAFFLITFVSTLTHLSTIQH